MIDEDQGLQRDLSRVRDLLKPPTGAAGRVATLALERGRARLLPRPVLVATIFLIACIAGVAFLRQKPRSAVVRIGNEGSVVFASAASGRRWLVSGARNAEPVSGRILMVTKGESR